MDRKRLFSRSADGFPCRVKVSLGANAVEGVLRCAIFVCFAAFFRHYLGEEFAKYQIVCSVVGLSISFLFVICSMVSHFVYLLFCRRFFMVSSRWSMESIGSSDSLAAAGMGTKTRRILGIVVGIADLLSLVWFVVCGVLMACVNIPGLIAAIVCAVFVLLFEGGVTIIKVRSLVHLIRLPREMASLNDVEEEEGPIEAVSARARGESFVQLAPFVQIAEYLLMAVAMVYATAKQITMLVYHPTFPFTYIALFLYICWSIATIALAIVFQLSVRKSRKTGMPPSLVARIFCYVSFLWPFVYVFIIFIEMIVYESYSKTSDLMRAMYVHGFMDLDTFLVVVGIPVPFFWIWAKHMLLRQLGIREGLRESEFEEEL